MLLGMLLKLNHFDNFHYRFIALLARYFYFKPPRAG
jgi:hypothetical protein